MKIIGNGMIARAFMPYQAQLEAVVIFASGVSNSSETDPAAYARECDLLIETLQSCKHDPSRIVYFSSGGTIYGNYAGLRDEKTPLYPRTPYGRQQLLCEALIKNSGAPYLITRLANLIGPGQNHTQLIPALVDQALAGHAHLFQHATRDLLDVEDFAPIVIRLLASLASDENETVIVASGISLPIAEIFSQIQSELGTTADISLLDRGDVQRFNIEKLQHQLAGQVHFDERYPAQVVRKYVHHAVQQKTGAQ